MRTPKDGKHKIKRRKRPLSPEIISVKEIVDRWGGRAGKTKVYAMLRLGIIPSIRVGEHSYIIPRKAFDTWWESAGRLRADVSLDELCGDSAPSS